MVAKDAGTGEQRLDHEGPLGLRSLHFKLVEFILENESVLSIFDSTSSITCSTQNSFRIRECVEH